MDETFPEDGPFPKPIYTINGISSLGNTGDISFLVTDGLTVSSADNAIILSSTGGSVPVPTAHGQIPIGSAGGTFTTTTLTAGSGISIVNGPDSIVLSTTSGSVPVPTAHGQIPIGSAGGTFTTTTLTAGSGISIVNGPDSITISSTPAPPIQMARVCLSFLSNPARFPGGKLSLELGATDTWNKTIFSTNAIMNLNEPTPIIPATNITVGDHNITFTQAGTYLIEVTSALAQTPLNPSPTVVYMQLILNNTKILFVGVCPMSTAYPHTTGNLNISYAASFSVGDIIDFRLGQDGYTKENIKGFYSVNILVDQLPTSI